MDQAVPLNGMMVAHVRGRLGPGMLEAGLVRLQQRHPMLRAHIVPGPRPLLSTANPRPIALRVVPRTGPDTWHAVAEEELNRPFLPGENPLWRAVLVAGADAGAEECELLLSHHHVLADATAVTSCFRELLTDAAALSRGESLAPVVPLPMRPSLNELLVVGGPRPRLKMFTYMNSFLWRHLLARLRRPRKLSIQGGDGRVAPPPAQRRSRLLHHTLTPAQTAALAARCRQEGTTVQGALGAALLLALYRDLGPAPATVGCFSTVNLRDRLREALDGEVGLFVSQATTFHRLRPGPGDPNHALWELARDFRVRLVHVIDRGEPYMTFPWLGLFIPRGKDPLPGLLRRVDLSAPFAAGITNAGRLPLPTRYGALTLVKLHIVIGVALIAPIVVAATTLTSAQDRDGPGTGDGARNGDRDGAATLCCNLLYAEPLISRERALAIADHMMDLLRTASKAARLARSP